jgi:hypothetical protein
VNLLTLCLVLPGAFALLPSEKPSPGNSFRSRSATSTGTVHLNGLIERVFPFFTPLGERAWAPGWNPQPIYPADGITREGMVFRTQDQQAMLWVVSHYDPAKHEISYVTVTHEILVRQIVISCHEENGATLANVTYTMTGLSPEGNHMIEEYAGKGHADRLKHWDEAINYLLRTGKRIPHNVD